MTILGDKREARAAALVDKANDVTREGDYAKAIKLWTTVVDESLHLFDKPANIYIARSSCYLELGELEKALQDAEDAIFHEPRSTEAHFYRGGSLAEMIVLGKGRDRFDEAWASLQRVLDAEPKNKDAREWRGRIEHLRTNLPRGSHGYGKPYEREVQVELPFWKR